jgi:hypothetical protein
MLLVKTDPVQADPTAGVYAAIDPEAMRLRHEARLLEIESQMKNFVPQRREEVKSLKEELRSPVAGKIPSENQDG